MASGTVGTIVATFQLDCFDTDETACKPPTLHYQQELRIFLVPCQW